MPKVAKREWLTYPDAARHLGVSERQLRRWVERRRVPFHRLAGRVRFDQRILDDWLNSQLHEPEDAA